MFDNDSDINEPLIKQDDNIPSPSSNIIQDWSQVNITNFNRTRQVNIQFGELWNSAKEINFSTSDGHLNVEQFNSSNIDMSNKNNTNDTFLWDKRSKETWSNGVELREIIIKDLNNNFHSIYKNDKLFK